MPIYNGLTDEWHPTQILADFLTFREHLQKPLAEVSFCYLGDARFNMADSYLIGGAKLGMDVRIASPESLWPRDEIVELARVDGRARRARRSRSPTTSTRRYAAATCSSPTSGSRWASRTRSGRSGSSC